MLPPLTITDRAAREYADGVAAVYPDSSHLDMDTAAEELAALLVVHGRERRADDGPPIRIRARSRALGIDVQAHATRTRTGGYAVVHVHVRSHRRYLMSRMRLWRWLLRTDLRGGRACREARDWIAEQGDVSPAELWARCPRGSYLLWALERAGVPCEAEGYRCAERARLSALWAQPGACALAACSPIVDRQTALAAEAEARAAEAQAEAAEAEAAEAWDRAAALRAGRAARVALAAARAAAEAARAEAAEAAVSSVLASVDPEAEELALAEWVRAHYSMPEVLR